MKTGTSLVLLGEVRRQNARARAVLEEFVRVYEGTALKGAFEAAAEPERELFQVWIRAKEELARRPAVVESPR